MTDMKRIRAPLELGRLYQLGYVTNDMDRALEYAAKTFGVADFTDFGVFDSVVADGLAKVRVAHGHIGEFIFELIEPMGGADAMYSDYLPKDRFAIRLHHSAYYLDDPGEWEALKQEVASRGVTIAVDGRSPSSEYYYLDLREELGQYAEVVHRPNVGAGGLDAEAERSRVKAAIAALRDEA